MQSVTGTWHEAIRSWKSMFFAKCYLTVIKFWFLIDFCRVPIEDFRKFHDFGQLLHGSRKQFASRLIDFGGFGMDPVDFELKIHEISAFCPKCYRDVARSDPELKIHVFCKVLF